LSGATVAACAIFHGKLLFDFCGMMAGDQRVTRVPPSFAA
jgi:hypothetical protein